MQKVLIQKQEVGCMYRKFYKTVVLFIIIVFFAGCTSYNKKVQTCVENPEYVQTYSKTFSLTKGSRVGVLPFDCRVQFIGSTISENTVRNMANLGIDFIDSLELTQIMKKKNAYYHGLAKARDYDKIIKLADLDYLMVGDVQIYSPRRKRIISATVHILDGNGDPVVKVRFEPPSGRWKMPAIGVVLAKAIKKELKKQGYVGP